MHLTFGAASDVGLVRTQNEDSYVAGGGVFAVCDGMGGALAGEVASETACRNLRELGSEGNSADRLQAAVRRANAEILKRSIEEPGMAGMGTTLTAAVRQGDSLVIAHVGDSRAYLLRGRRLRQLTEDHSLVAELVREGSLTPEEAAVHPHRSVITRALGTEEEVLPDIIALPLEVGDRLLLCSDGVSGLVSDDRLQQVLESAATAQQAAEDLVAEALAHGGDDNATAVVLFCSEGDGEGDVDPGDVVVGPARRQGGEEVQSPPRAPGAPPAPSPRTGAWRKFFRSRRLWMTVGIVVLLLVIGISALAVFNSTVYYVGTDGDLVVLYRGLPATILGVKLSRVVEVGRASYSSLQPYLRERVDAHTLTTKEEGQRFLRSLDSES